MEEKSRARVALEVILTPFLLLGLMAYMLWTGIGKAMRDALHAIGYHGRHLERISSNTFHIDYRCKLCKREVHRFRH